jgi:hypothetical protein
MRQVLFASLLITLLFTGGCGPAKPITESEFKGFCYQYGGSENSGCGDIISICDEFTTVMSIKQTSRDACQEACKDIKQPLYMRYVVTDCAGAPNYANDWCIRYCRTNYPN